MIGPTLDPTFYYKLYCILLIIIQFIRNAKAVYFLLSVNPLKLGCKELFSTPHRGQKSCLVGVTSLLNNSVIFFKCTLHFVLLN